MHSKVKDLTCYGLGTYNIICAGETVECKCITESPLLSWYIRNSSIDFYASSDDTSECCDGFSAIFNETSFTSTLTFSLNESECIACVNDNDTGNRTTTIIYPGTCSVTVIIK